MHWMLVSYLCAAFVHRCWHAGREAAYFNVTHEVVVEIGRVAAKAGIEMIVLDDGWFGERNDTTAGLGDWFPNRTKLPYSLDGLVRDVNNLGLKFGIWMEPEMVSMDSKLYKEHPDWCLHVPSRGRTTGRNQLVLDFSRECVRDHIYNEMDKILSSCPVEYVKWDMNRHLTEVFSQDFPAERQGEVAHRFLMGVYEVLGRITRQHPDVLFETCSGGGGRFDAGMLFFAPQIWTSVRWPGRVRACSAALAMLYQPWAGVYDASPLLARKRGFMSCCLRTRRGAVSFERLYSRVLLVALLMCVVYLPILHGLFLFLAVFFRLPLAQDNTDALSRVQIQMGTSLAYPVSSMGSHVSSVPNHQTLRTTSMKTRSLVALCGSFGYELDPRNLTTEELAEIRRYIELHKMLSPIVIKGDMYRMWSPFTSDSAAWMFVSQDKVDAVAIAVNLRREVGRLLPRLTLRGLSPNKVYEVEELCPGHVVRNIDTGAIDFDSSGVYQFGTPLRMSGRALCSAGLPVRLGIPSCGGFVTLGSCLCCSFWQAMRGARCGGWMCGLWVPFGHVAPVRIVMRLLIHRPSPVVRPLARFLCYVLTHSTAPLYLRSSSCLTPTASSTRSRPLRARMRLPTQAGLETCSPHSCCLSLCEACCLCYPRFLIGPLRPRVGGNVSFRTG